MGEKYCDEHDDDEGAGSMGKKLCGIFLVLVVLLLITIFLIWAILRPSKPRIVLQDASIYSLNLASSSPTGPNFLNATIQVTLACRNSNDRIGILYEKLDVVALYKHQQITLPTALPTGYQSSNDDVIWSPFLFSFNSPIAPYLAAQLGQEQQMKLVMLQIKMYGRIKWKVGAWMSGRYHLYVNCPAYIAFGSGRVGVVVGEVMKVELASKCGVDVGIGG